MRFALFFGRCDFVEVVTSSAISSGATASISAQKAPTSTQVTPGLGVSALTTQGPIHVCLRVATVRSAVVLTARAIGRGHVEALVRGRGVGLAGLDVGATTVVSIEACMHEDSRRPMEA